MFRTLSWWAAGLLVAFVLVGGLSPSLEAASSIAERKIEEALDSPTELQFIETPLQDVVDFLKDYHKIEIQIDEKALAEVGIDPGAALTEDLKGVALRSALNLMLRDLELTYFIGDETLVITTQEEAECRLSAKVYPVDDLVRRSDAPGIRSDPTHGGTVADYDTIIEIITSTIQPTTWDDVGGPGSIAAAPLGSKEMLVISQTYHVHREIATLLSDLRRVADTDERPPLLIREGRLEPPRVEVVEPPPLPARRRPPRDADPFAEPPEPPKATGDINPFGAPPEEPPAEVEPKEIPEADPFGGPARKAAPPAKSADADPFSE